MFEVDTLDYNIHFCKHCNDAIYLLCDVPRHKCFVGKKVYSDHENDTLLYAENHESCDVYMRQMDGLDTVHDTQYFKYYLVSTTSNASNVTAAGSSPYTDKPPSIKQNAVWSSNSIKTLLSLYEANKHMLENPKKKTKIWTAISTDLKDTKFEVTPDQVRWKYNRLYDKYKKCLDNNKRTGSALMTFEFYDQMDEILNKDKNADFSYVISSKLPGGKKNIGRPIVAQSSQKENVENERNEKSKNINTDINSSNQYSLAKKHRPKHGTGSERAKVKASLEQQFSQHLREFNESQKVRQKRSEKLVKLKIDALQLKKRQLDIREKEITARNTLMNKKLKHKEQRHEEILEIEKLKCELLKKLLNTADNKSDT